MTENLLVQMMFKEKKNQWTIKKGYYDFSVSFKPIKLLEGYSRFTRTDCLGLIERPNNNLEFLFESILDNIVHHYRIKYRERKGDTEKEWKKRMKQ